MHSPYLQVSIARLYLLLFWIFWVFATMEGWLPIWKSALLAAASCTVVAIPVGMGWTAYLWYQGAENAWIGLLYLMGSLGVITATNFHLEYKKWETRCLNVQSAAKSSRS